MMHDCPTCGGGPGNVYGCLCHRGKPPETNPAKGSPELAAAFKALGLSELVAQEVLGDAYAMLRSYQFIVHLGREKYAHTEEQIATVADRIRMDSKWRACVDASVGAAALSELRKRFDAAQVLGGGLSTTNLPPTEPTP